MSIEDQIIDRVGRGMLFPLIPAARGATIRRAMFVGEALWGQLISPIGDAEWEDRIGRLRADLEAFVTEPLLEPKYLFLLYRADDGVWEVRSARPDPSVRVLGLFADRDVFISTNYALRAELDGWQSRAWKEVKRMAKAVWRQLFDPFVPVITMNVNDVIRGAVNGRYYKERG